MMKKILFISGLVVAGAVMVSCNKVRRNPGRVYMPDMAYSRAYETYASTEGLQQKRIHYTAMPVPGTIARGDTYPYTLNNDSAGYIQSASVKNPLDSVKVDLVEAERLYLVNCGICHGAKLDGNGPIYNGGKGPFPNAPRNFLDDFMKKMPDGTYFHSITYGKGNMGPYASQLSTPQRWMVISYIRSKQGMGGAAKDSTATTAMPVAKDSTAKKDTTAGKTK